MTATVIAGGAGIPAEPVVAVEAATTLTVVAVAAVMRRLAASRLRAVADRAGLVPTGALRVRPAPLRHRSLGVGGAIAPVLRADAAGAAVATGV